MLSLHNTLLSTIFRHNIQLNDLSQGVMNYVVTVQAKYNVHLLHTQTPDIWCNMQ